MKSCKLFTIFAVVSLLVIFSSAVIADENNEDNLADLSTLQTQADQTLQNNIIPNIKISAHKNGTEINDKNDKGEVMVESVDYIGLSDFVSSTNVFIKFTGSKATPETPIIISFNSEEELVKQTTVDKDGEWSIKVPISFLPTGNSLTYIQTEIQGVRSNKISIASFDVAAQQRISTQTWYFIIFVSLAIITLLFAIILQLRRNAKDLEPGHLI